MNTSNYLKIFILMYYRKSTVFHDRLGLIKLGVLQVDLVISITWHLLLYAFTQASVDTNANLSFE